MEMKNRKFQGNKIWKRCLDFYLILFVARIIFHYFHCLVTNVEDQTNKWRTHILTIIHFYREISRQTQDKLVFKGGDILAEDSFVFWAEFEKLTLGRYCKNHCQTVRSNLVPMWSTYLCWNKALWLDAKSLF